MVKACFDLNQNNNRSGKLTMQRFSNFHAPVIACPALPQCSPRMLQRYEAAAAARRSAPLTIQTKAIMDCPRGRCSRGTVRYEVYDAPLTVMRSAVGEFSLIDVSTINSLNRTTAAARISVSIPDFPGNRAREPDADLSSRIFSSTLFRLLAHSESDFNSVVLFCPHWVRITAQDVSPTNQIAVRISLQFEQQWTGVLNCAR